MPDVVSPIRTYTGRVLRRDEELGPRDENVLVNTPIRAETRRGEARRGKERLAEDGR